MKHFGKKLVLFLLVLLMPFLTNAAKADTVLITVKKPSSWHFGHTSVISQDEKGRWFYFYWGNNAAYKKEVPEKYMKNIDSFNEWLYEIRKIKKELKYSDGFYAYGTYITGDFTKTTKYYSEIVKDYKWWKYNFLFKNCTVVSKKALAKGILEDGKAFEEQIAYTFKEHLPFWRFMPHCYRKTIEKNFENTKYTAHSDWGIVKNETVKNLIEGKKI